MEDVPLTGDYFSRGRPVRIRWGTGYLRNAARLSQVLPVF